MATTITTMKSTIPARVIGRGRRRGAIISMELVLVLPILLGLLLGAIEFGLVWSANQRVAVAAQQACRLATLPGTDEDALRLVIERTLARQALIESYTFEVQGGALSGGDVVVEVRAPMLAASPDLLRPLGLSIRDRTISARAVMRKE